MAHKKKQRARVVVDRAYYEILLEKAQLLDKVFDYDGMSLNVSQNDYREFSRLDRRGDAIEEAQAEPYVPPKE